MELTLKRKLLSAGAGLCLTGFVVDRVFLSSPPAAASAAEADGFAVQSTAAGPSPDARRSAQSAASPADTIVARLERARGDAAGPVDDAFQPPTAWFEPSKPGEAAPRARVQEAPTDLRLTTVMTGVRPAAVINGVTIPVGQVREVRAGASTVRVRLLELREPTRTEPGSAMVLIDESRQTELAIAHEPAGG
ncbi:MAG TPA: hypothetical protein VD971_04040 [Phycisphaerales bacterium]|nr:hypothetical protein [Phycisphaerales bacterium]